MLQNILKITLRLIRRDRTYAAINFSGLTLGLFAFILLYLYVSFEWSYDRYHENYDRIYRVYKEGKEGVDMYMGSNKFLVVQAPLADAIKTEVPEIDRITRIKSGGNVIMKIGAETFFENKYYFLDPEAFSIFSFQVSAGATSRWLENPTGIIIDETLAMKYFGSPQNAIGKVISCETFKPVGDFVVETVIKDVPENSHFKMGILFQFDALTKLTQPGDLTSWSNSNYYTYLTLKEDVDLNAVNEKITQIAKKNIATDPPLYKLQPFNEIYLHSDMNFDIAPTGSWSRLVILGCIGVLVLLIACINYMNMTTAKATQRAKEIGLRKTTGANRAELIAQFVGESVFMAFAATMTACVLVKLALPFYAQFLEKKISFNFISQPGLLIMLAGITLVVGVLSGAYPAFVLSSLHPVHALKGKGMDSAGFRLRDVLVVVQFTISGVLIFSTLVIWNQLSFIGKKELGFNRQQVVIVRLRDQGIRPKYEEIKAKLMQNPSIIGVTASTRAPSEVNSSQGREWSAKDGRRDIESFYVEIDTDYVRLYELQLLAGRNLSSTLAKKDAIINEAMLAELGYTVEEIIGMEFSHARLGDDLKLHAGDTTRIIGVVKDFHFQDFKQKIQPLRLKPFFFGPPSVLSVKVNQVGMKDALKHIEATINSFSDKYPFEYSFYDDLYYRAYATEIKTGKLMIFFAGLTIFIAAMGIYGLIIFLVNRRTKEIGIRKALGASVGSVIKLLSSHFAILVLIGYGLSCLAGYYFMTKWLTLFVYQAEIGFAVFAITFVAIALITGATVLNRILKATAINPAAVLRSE